MAQQKSKASILSSLSSFPTDNASAEAAWRQALLLRELSRDERVVARKRRTEAEAARAQAEHEAITATKQLCSELQAQARMKLQQAEDELAEASRIKADAESDSKRMMTEARAELDHAIQTRQEAEAYAEEVGANARSAADALMEQTRSGAEEMASRMRRETAEDIRKILTEIEVARAAAEDELETQRILSETARVRAFSQGLAAEAAPAEMAKTNAPVAEPKKRKARRVSVKKATVKKAPAKKTPARKPVAKKPARAKKPTPVKAVAKKAVAKKAVAARKSAMKKAA